MRQREKRGNMGQNKGKKKMYVPESHFSLRIRFWNLRLEGNVSNSVI